MKQQRSTTSPRKAQRIFTFAAIIIFIFNTLLLPLNLIATGAEINTEYQIYPTVQKITYKDSKITLQAQANVVVEPGVDTETQARLAQVLKLQNISQAETTIATQAGKTQILVGINSSGKTVDQYVKELVQKNKLSFANNLFTTQNQHDPYLLAIVPGDNQSPDTILLLGKDTDSVFYGLTTLYRIFQQVNDRSVRAFTIEDYADVLTRGFIEGYYGEPWSTEDRIELMRWAGYQKLNAYVYAPKDDPKHNKNWRELYTPQELQSKIAPLAKAGNDSKARFVYALHPFMNAPITNANYAASLEVLKNKFTQVMDYGVRQIAVLADDANDQGAQLYTKLLEDLTKWLETKQAEKNQDGTLKYPGLKKTLIFCPVAYYGFGESWYQNLPENVQVVNTGGRVWGKVDQNFVTRFQNTSGGRSPFMWINWPCSDNDKDALHMGGHNAFLGHDVQPGTVEGVVLNPMQQSEPSKQAIFMNADFSWNLWTSTAHADQAWEDSFSYVDHNSPIPTDTSKALRNLSEHMRRILGGGVVFENNESASVKTQLLAFQEKVTVGTATAAETAEIGKIYAALGEDAKTYRENPGTPRTLTQIQPWINAWQDLSAAAKHFLAAYSASLTNDNKTMVEQYNLAKTAMEAYGKHGFSYIDHTEYAKVGKMYLAPLLDVLANKLAEKVVLAIGPETDMTAYITSRTDTPSDGTPLTAAYDGSLATKLVYKTPNTLTAGTYFGLLKSKPFDLKSVKFVQGDGKDFIESAKLQVFDAQNGWTDVPGQDNLSGAIIENYDLNLPKVQGVRLIASRDNSRDAWPTIAEIMINPPRPIPSIPGEISAPDTVVHQNNNAANAQDDNEESVFWIHNSGGDYINQNNPVVLTFDQPTEINRVLFVQGPKDKIDAGALEYLPQGSETWVKLADVNKDTKQEFNFARVTAKAVRIAPDKQYPIWWQIAEFRAFNVPDTVAEKLQVNAAKPVFVNPAASDPADCNTKPYVEITPTTGVQYEVAVGERVLSPDENGKYFYAFGETVKVRASAEEGYELSGESEWAFTAEINPACEDPQNPSSPDTPETTKPVDESAGSENQNETTDPASSGKSQKDQSRIDKNAALARTGANTVGAVGIALFLILCGASIRYARK